MNALTESELVEISASGDGMPVASWPTGGLFYSPLNLAWLSWLLPANNLSEQRMAD